MSLLCPFTASAYEFTSDLRAGSSGASVRELQKVLNQSPSTQVALSGAGSPGAETSYFGPATKRAVVVFQEFYRSEILLPVGLFRGTGVVGPSTRKKLNALFSASAKTPVAPALPPTQTAVVPEVRLPNPQVPDVSPVPVAPKPLAEVVKPLRVTGVSPSRVRTGETVTIFGEGFSLTDNSVVIAYGALSHRFEHLSSLDGKTIQFVFEPPEVSVTEGRLRELPPEELAKIEGPLVAAGGSLRDVVYPYRGIRGEAELDGLLSRYGYSIESLYDQFFVTVEADGKRAMSKTALLSGLRRLSFGSVAILPELKESFLSVLKQIGLLPETALAQYGGGATSGVDFYCTCSPGHMSFLADFSGPLTGLTYFAPGFVPNAGSTIAPGLWLGGSIPLGAPEYCWMESGPICVPIPGNLPFPPWGHGT